MKKLHLKGIYYFINVLIISLLIVSCQGDSDNSKTSNSGKGKVNPKKVLPEAYIYSATRGIVEANSELTVNFRADFTIKGLEYNKDLSGIFKITPKVQGKTYLINKRQLVFIPDQTLKYGKEYSCRVRLDKLYELSDNQENQFIFDFKVMEQSLSIGNGQLRPYSINDTKKNYYEFSVYSSQAYQIENPEDILTARMNGEKLIISQPELNVIGNKKYRIENIIRGEEEQVMTLYYDGAKIGSDDKGTIDVRVPPLDMFTLTEIKVENSPSQHVILSFSDPIDPDFDLKGIVEIVGDNKTVLEIDVNRILVYPKENKIGEVTVSIGKELTNKNGYKLKKDLLKKVMFGQIKPQVKLIDDGNILPGTDNWKIHFKAVNLSKVDIIVRKIYHENILQFFQVNNYSGDNELNRVSEIVYKELVDLGVNKENNDGKWHNYEVNLKGLIAENNKGIYRVDLRIKKDYSLYECDHDPDTDDQGYYYSYNRDYYTDNYYFPEKYSWQRRDNPCSESYFYYERFINKNIYSTNIGLTVKGNTESGYRVFAIDLVNTDKLSDMDIKVFNYQKRLVYETSTNSEGIAFIPYEKEIGVPWIITAQKNDDITYLRVKDNSPLSYSKFNIAGSTAVNGIDGFIYGERGVWRPGDTIFLTLIAMDHNHSLPENHPATLKLYDPQGKLKIEKSISRSVNGFYSFKPNTSSDDISGIWRAEFQVGGATFTKRLRIENIKPNRLKIKLVTTGDELSEGNNSANLEVRWLHGGIASGLRAEIKATLRPYNTTFDKFPEYNFENKNISFYTPEKTILDTKLNNKGTCNFTVELPETKRAPGKIMVSMATRVFEKGGDFSISQDKIVYSPYDSYVGIKIPITSRRSSHLMVDSTYTFELATVDENGQPISVKDLNVQIIKKNWRWWYGYYDDDSYYYSADYDNTVLNEYLDTKNGKGLFTFKVTYPEWGYYFVKVTNPISGHVCTSKFYMDWPDWYSRSNRTAPGDASQMTISTDKSAYKVGDTIKISFPTSPNSKLLVSLERDNHIFKTWWQSSTANETLIELVATKEMAPNIYASVTMFQAYENDNDLPVRMYGVVPISVNDSETILYPEIELPEEIRPNSRFTIGVKERNNRKMTYTLAVVDEGLTDLTKFKTPDPHSTFYSKRGLFVNTWDMYDYVVRSFRGSIYRTFGIGGGLENIEEEEGNMKKANRFKPVVDYLGPFTIDQGESATHELLMENYIGSVKVMIVAGNDGAFGSASRNMKVKQPLMVLSTLPRVLAPGEDVSLPVSIFVMDSTINNIDIEIEANELFDVPAEKKHITVDSIGETVVFFKIKTSDMQGVGELTTLVTSGKEKSRHRIEIQVRNPNPRTYSVFHKLLNENSVFEYKPEFTGIKGTNEVSFSLSYLPQINLQKRLQYLIRYPYHCIEQTTSAAFPQLFLDKLSTLSTEQSRRIEYNIKYAIERISRMQSSAGGFAYWPGAVSPSDWGSSYAGHFLLMAKDKGYGVPQRVISNWIKYQMQASNRWRPNYDIHKRVKNDLAQAYRLYTLALAGKPNLGAMNKLRLMEGIHYQARYQLSAAYSLIGQKKVARELINNATYVEPERSYWYYNYGSSLRDKAMQVIPLYLIDDPDYIKLILDIAKELRSDYWMSTQTTAFSLIAVSTVASDPDNKDAIAFQYKWEGPLSDTVYMEKPIYNQELSMSDINKLTISNHSDVKTFLTVTTSGIPELGTIVSESSNLNMDISYHNMDGKKINPSVISHGTDFYVRVNIKNPGKFGHLENLALSQIFPSGWEIINTRMLDTGSDLKSSEYDYIDYRDDRVDIFFDLRGGKSKQFIVLLNAAYKGKFHMPATECTDMYNDDVKAIEAGRWVEVK